MADYIYLLEHRLSVAQRAAVLAMRTLALEKGLTLFLVGGAVRDLTSGSPVRDLDFVLQGDALTLRTDLERVGARITGESAAQKALYLTMADGVRAELGSTLSATWPKPGKPVYKPGTLGEDLRRRDFTANAMALSLNDGSYGLLIDPLNGVADIENRELRLVSNYGFIEEPVRLVRAARLMARLGWTLEEKTQGRYETGQQEGYIAGLNEFHKGYELEELVHEEDPLRVLKRLEAEGWMKALAPFWTSAKINAAELDKLRETQVQLQMQGILADGSTASFPLLTNKLSAQEMETLKASFPRRGFVEEIEGLEDEAKAFAGLLTAKTAAAPSAAWKLITQTRPDAVLQAAYGSRSPAVQAKFKAFYGEWPQAQQRVPYTLMQEMRIVPELEGYAALVDTLVFELMDGRLSTTEEMKAFLEPYSPPAPPPPVNLKRSRAAKKDAKPAKSRSKKVKTEEEDLEDTDAALEDDADEPRSPEDTEDGKAGEDRPNSLDAVEEEDSEADEPELDEDLSSTGDEAEPEDTDQGEELNEKPDADEEEPASAPVSAKRASKGRVSAEEARPVPKKKGAKVQLPAEPDAGLAGKRVESQSASDKTEGASKAGKAATSVVGKQASPSGEGVASRSSASTNDSKQAVKRGALPTEKQTATAPAAAKKGTAPVKNTPVKTAPAKAVSAKAAPARVASAKVAPAKVASAKVASAKTAPAKAAPAKSAPAAAVSTKTASAKTAPAKAAPAKKTAAKAVAGKPGGRDAASKGKSAGRR